jgi:hypothetical protein
MKRDRHGNWHTAQGRIFYEWCDFALWRVCNYSAFNIRGNKVKLGSKSKERL